MSDFGFYSGDEFLAKTFEERDTLIDCILHKKDSVILAGKPKSGKSILLFNLICSLTSGEPFLDEFEVKKPCKVLYIQLEGSLDDSQNRFNRMIGSLAFERSNFFIMFSPPLDMNNNNTMSRLIDDIKHKMDKPDVIIIDPIYFALGSGASLSDDSLVRGFTGQIRILQECFDCAVILTHHFKKARRDQTGKILAPDDDDVFGSVFFQAWITHQFLFDYDKTTKARFMQCNVQRSGRIKDKIMLRLVEPDPLYYELLDVYPAKEEEIVKYLTNHADKRFEAREIYEAINMPKASFYKLSRKLINEGKINKTKGDRHCLFFIPTQG